MIRPLIGSDLTLAEIGAQWDQIADERAAHLREGLDLSMQRFIIPHVVELLGPPGGRVLDAGCGLGLLTRELGAGGFDVMGIDVSAQSVSLASHADGSELVEFQTTSAESLALREPGSFDIVVANMSLMSTPNLDEFVSALRTLCRDAGGLLVASLTHPAFWPRYWGYESDPEYRYDQELIVEQPFRISRASTEVATVHIHRPIERYVQALDQAGFRVREILEPMPQDELMAEYPEPWVFPRFIFLSADTR